MAVLDQQSLRSEHGRLRMQTMVRLRWFGVIGQLITVLFVHWGLGYDLPAAWCLVLIAISAWVNVGLGVLFPARHRLGAGLATLILAYDILGLAGLLYLTGGLANPFALLFVAPVVVSAATLPARSTLLLGTLAVAAAGVLIVYHQPLPWRADETLSLPPLYLAGVLAAIVSGMVFLVLYTARLSKESRLMSTALAATELVLAREQRLHALDGLAAAAAHELGTPLATIALVAREIERDLARHDHLAEDVELLRGQADRCREILRKLTRSPGEQDPHHVSLPLTQLIQEAALPYGRPPKTIAISARARWGLPSIEGREPIGERRPGVIFGLGNLIENAVDFAQARVEIEALWDEREVSIAIIDDGPGFSPEIIDTLGDPFVTTRPSGIQDAGTGREGSGLGLGFFIAKTLLERSGARVTLANREAPATGAIVRISWPRAAFDLPIALGDGGRKPSADTPSPASA